MMHTTEQAAAMKAMGKRRFNLLRVLRDEDDLGNAFAWGAVITWVSSVVVLLHLFPVLLAFGLVGVGTGLFCMFTTIFLAIVEPHA